MISIYLTVMTTCIHILSHYHTIIIGNKWQHTWFNWLFSIIICIRNYMLRRHYKFRCALGFTWAWRVSLFRYQACHLVFIYWVLQHFIYIAMYLCFYASIYVLYLCIYPCIQLYISTYLPTYLEHVCIWSRVGIRATLRLGLKRIISTTQSCYIWYKL